MRLPGKRIAVAVGIVFALVMMAGAAMAMTNGVAGVNVGAGSTQGGVLSVPDVTAPPGSVVTVTVSMSGVGEDVYSADIVLQYNESVVQARSVSKGDLVSSWSMAGNVGVPGEVRIALAGSEPVSGAGALASVVFEVVGSEGMSTELTFARGELNEGTVGVGLQDGRISVGSSPCYDFDGSGLVDAPDLQMVASHWRQHSGDAGWDARFDVNNDGVINVVDVLEVAAHMGEACP